MKGRLVTNKQLGALIIAQGQSEGQRQRDLTTYCESADVAGIIPFHLGNLEDMLSGPEVGEGCGTCDACKCDRDDGPRAAVICTAEAGGEVMYVSDEPPTTAVR